MFEQRADRLRQSLKAHGLDGMVVTHNVDLYYFTGTMQAGFLIVPVVGAPIFYVRRSVTRAMRESKVKVEALGSIKTLGERVASAIPSLARRCKLAAAFDTLPVDVYERLRAALPEAHWTNGSAIVRTLRMIKDETELSSMRKAAAIVDEALSAALPKLTAGMKEIEFLAEVEHALRRSGHLGLMRVRAMNMEVVTGIAASGAAAAEPTAFDGPAGGKGLHTAFPMSGGWSAIEPGEPILLDIGCNVEGYVIDQTRLAVIGELPDDLQRAYDASEAMLRSLEERLKPGADCEELYLHALELAERYGLSEHFMGYRSDAVKFVGHGIGLEIDEWPVLARGFSMKLEAGMVIAVEPKFTFPGRGVVGIENSYLITKEGFEKLTVSREGVWSI